MKSMKPKKVLKRVKRLLGLQPKAVGPKIFNRIEIFGSCPAKCPFCHSGIEKYSLHKVMAPAIFATVIEHLRSINLLTQDVYLYDRGEPFCHQDIGEILDICRANKLHAYISTNASKIPDLSRNQWDTIKGIKISLSGITEDSYRRIYGLDLQKALANIETISKRVDRSKTKLSINWLKYTFNTNEEEIAKKKFRQLGFLMDAKKATLIEIEKIIAYLENRLPVSDVKIVKEYLIEDDKRNRFLNQMKNTEVSKHPNRFICEQWNQIIVNWDGVLLKCCGLSPDNPDNRLGEILSMDYQSIKSIKLQKNSTCTSCISHQVAKPTNKKWEAMWNL